MPEDGAVVKQLGGEAVDHNFYVDDGYLLYEYEGFKAISSYLPLFPRLSFPCPILTSVFFFSDVLPFHQLPKRGRRRSAFYCPLAKTTRVPLGVATVATKKWILYSQHG